MKSLLVVAGVIDLDDDAAQVMQIVAAVIHEDFNSETHYNNIALLKVHCYVLVHRN